MASTIAFRSSRSSRENPGQADLEALRGEAVRRVAVLAMVLALLLLVCESLTQDPEAWGPPSVALGLLGFGVYRLSRSSGAGAALGLVAGLFAVAALCLLPQPGGYLGVLFAPVVVVASIALGWRYAVGVALAASVLLVALTSGDGPPLSQPGALSLALIWLSTALGWLALGPLYTALDWSWQSYAEARQKTDQLRQEQQRLAEALKSLDVAYYRVAAANAELARARRTAEEARRSKAEFAATISHELRTPLNLITGFSEMMVLAPQNYGDEVLPASYRGDVEAIYRNAAHILNLVDDVLDLAQIEAHRMPLHVQMASVARIVEEAAATVRSLLRDKRLDLAIEVAADLPAVRADPGRIRQVVINLLNNAARCTDDGGVCVSARAVDNDVVVSVADTGVGIAPEDLARIFEEFKQASDRSGHRTGSGLGLTICKRFVELHGGSIWAESQPGVGSTFHFSLPTHGTVVALPRPPDVDRLIGGQPLPGRTVAVRDGSPEAVKAFQRYLDGYQVVDQAGSRRGAGADPEVPPSALILAAESAGVAASGLAGGLPDDLPVVVCPLRTRGRDAQDLGVAEYLVKPTTADQLRTALDRVARPRHCVLVVDDDPEMVWLLVRMLRSVDPACRVLEARGGAAALTALRADRPDVVLLDLLMPGIDGYQVIEAMRADPRLREVPVVVLSAIGRADESITASMVGVTRSGGLTVGEAMRCARAALDALLDDRR